MCDHGVGGVTPPPAPVSRRGFLFKLGIALQRAGGSAHRRALGRLCRFSGPSSGRAGVDRAGAPRELPGAPDAPGLLHESVQGAVGRKDRRHPVLGAPAGGRALPGVRHQLHAPRLSHPLVPGVRALHVSVPWRRVLRGRPSRVRAARHGPSTSTSTASRMASSGCAGVRSRPCRSRCDAHGRLVRGAIAAQEAHSALGHPPGAPQLGQLVVRVRQRHPHHLHASDRDRHLPRARVRSVAERGLSRASST